jgi:hypothetical protein
MSGAHGEHIAIVGVDSFGYMELFEDDVVITKARECGGHLYVSNTRGNFQVGKRSGRSWSLYTVKAELFEDAGFKEAEEN